jgi:hypothetical protein
MTGSLSREKKQSTTGQRERRSINTTKVHLKNHPTSDRRAFLDGVHESSEPAAQQQPGLGSSSSQQYSVTQCRLALAAYQLPCHTLNVQHTVSLNTTLHAIILGHTIAAERHGVASLLG